MRIVVENLQKKIRISPDKIKKIAYKINLPPKFTNLKLVLYFIRNSLVKKLNKQFFHKNSLTDVISFYLTKDYAEVFIAPCVVKNNAVLYKTNFREELYRCIIHGVLHVLGYKDGTKKHKFKMWKRQESLLRKLIYEKD